MWQRYPVAAIFSTLFNQAKQRLKDLLSDQFIYADGMRGD